MIGAPINLYLPVTCTSVVLYKLNGCSFVRSLAKLLLCFIVLLTTVASVKVAKICDFGTARKLDREAMATWTGTPAWMAPEVHGNLSTKYR